MTKMCGYCVLAAASVIYNCLPFYLFAFLCHLSLYVMNQALMATTNQ